MGRKSLKPFAVVRLPFDTRLRAAQDKLGFAPKSLVLFLLNNFLEKDGRANRSSEGA